jgi:hypothetical protein
MYHNWFTQVFTPGGYEELSFKAGHSLCPSVSNPQNSPGPSNFTLHKFATTTTYDADANAMFDRIFALPFDQAVSGTASGVSYGGITQPYVYFIFNHEQDAKGPDGTPGKLYYSNGGTSGTKDTAADFIAAWQKLWNMAQTRAAAAGVPATRIRWCLCLTSYGFQVNRVTQYYPGTQYVDVVGSDGYSTSTGTSFASVQGAARSQCINWNKPICYPEMNLIANDSAARASWFTDIATWINADTAVTHEFINIWLASNKTYSNWAQYAINKAGVDGADGTTAEPDVHAAIATMITNLGGNAPRTVIGQQKPAAPTYPATPWVSGADGTTGTLTILADPSGENVTAHKFFIAPGVTAQLVNQTGANGIAAATLTYEFTGLAPGATYSVAAASGNSAGWSGFSQILTVQTINPGSNAQAPIINSATISMEGGTTTLVDVAVSATDPGNTTLHYSTTITGPGNFSYNFVTATQIGIVLPGPGTYTVTWQVTNSLSQPLTTTSTTTYSVPSTAASNTQYFGFDLTALQPGADPRDIGKSLLGTLVAIDAELNLLANTPSGTRAVLNSVGMTFDPGTVGGTTVASPAAGSFLWAAVCLNANQVQGIEIATIVPQIGTGTYLGIYGPNGQLTTLDNTNNGAVASFGGAGFVDTWMQAAAGPNTLILPTPLTNRTPGEIIWIGIWLPNSGVTQLPTIRTSTAPSIMAKAGGMASTPRWGMQLGLSGLPTSLSNAWSTFSTSASPNLPYIALY